MIDLIKKAACPLCGVTQPERIEIDDYHLRGLPSGWKVIRCDADAGGCDEVFLIRFKVNFEVKFETAIIQPHNSEE